MSLYGCRAEESALAILFPLMAGHNGYSQTVGQVGNPEQERPSIPVEGKVEGHSLEAEDKDPDICRT